MIKVQTIPQMDLQVGDVIIAHGAEWVNFEVRQHAPTPLYDPSLSLPSVSTRSACIAIRDDVHGWRIGPGGTEWNFQGNQRAGRHFGFRPAVIYQNGGAF